jgi:RNA 3'-terminal phosphate cyclase (ATP)
VRERVTIDGARGEGGGQILRTSLALSILTQRPLHMTNIRAGRAKPGLRRQHLACVDAAARLCNARVEGATLSSQEIVFEPNAITTTELVVDIGTAGSTTLVVQTVLVPAIAAGHALRLTVKGGTHNPLAPPFDFLDRVYAPHLRAMGADLTLRLDRHGFATGGHANVEKDDHNRGQLTIEIHASHLRPIQLLETTPIASRHATAIVSRLPTHVADRELGVVRERLGFLHADCEVRDVQSGGTANVLLLEVEQQSGARELVTVHGEKGLRAETVAERACDELAAFVAANVPVGEHLADQLLLPLAVAGGGAFRAAPLSLHATTNIDTIRAFLELPIHVGNDGIVTIG